MSAHVITGPGGRGPAGVHGGRGCDGQRVVRVEDLERRDLRAAVVLVGVRPRSGGDLDAGSGRRSGPGRVSGVRRASLKEVIALPSYSKPVVWMIRSCMLMPSLRASWCASEPAKKRRVTASVASAQVRWRRSISPGRSATKSLSERYSSSARVRPRRRWASFWKPARLPRPRGCWRHCSARLSAEDHGPWEEPVEQQELGRDALGLEALVGAQEGLVAAARRSVLVHGRAATRRTPPWRRGATSCRRARWQRPSMRNCQPSSRVMVASAVPLISAAGRAPSGTPTGGRMARNWPDENARWVVLRASHMGDRERLAGAPGALAGGGEDRGDGGRGRWCRRPAARAPAGCRRGRRGRTRRP